MLLWLQAAQRYSARRPLKRALQSSALRHRSRATRQPSRRADGSKRRQRSTWAPATAAVHADAGIDKTSHDGDVAPPIGLSTTFDDGADHVYSRISAPTRERCEAVLAALEGASFKNKNVGGTTQLALFGYRVRNAPQVSACAAWRTAWRAPAQDWCRASLERVVVLSLRLSALRLGFIEGVPLHPEVALLKDQVDALTQQLIDLVRELIGALGGDSDFAVHPPVLIVRPELSHLALVRL